MSFCRYPFTANKRMKNRALIVSVGNFYPDVDLSRRSGVKKDTQRLHKILTKLGFSVELKPSKNTLHKVIYWCQSPCLLIIVCCNYQLSASADWHKLGLNLYIFVEFDFNRKRNYEGGVE